jgi:prepilin-type processing-associated H-X9-DG protein
MQLVTTLRALAEGGRTIITTIHQPSSRLYQQLDKLILMSNGQMMYSGRAAEATRWFGRLGCTLPYGVNVADFVLDLASGEFEGVNPIPGATGIARKTTLIEVRTGQVFCDVRFSLCILVHGGDSNAMWCDGVMPQIELREWHD